jgi:hypothetical protein
MFFHPVLFFILLAVLLVLGSWCGPYVDRAAVSDLTSGMPPAIEGGLLVLLALRVPRSGARGPFATTAAVGRTSDTSRRYGLSINRRVCDVLDRRAMSF